MDLAAGQPPAVRELPTLPGRAKGYCHDRPRQLAYEEVENW